MELEPHTDLHCRKLVCRNGNQRQIRQTWQEDRQHEIRNQPAKNHGEEGEGLATKKKPDTLFMLGIDFYCRRKMAPDQPHILHYISPIGKRQVGS